MKEILKNVIKEVIIEKGVFSAIVYVPIDRAAL